MRNKYVEDTVYNQQSNRRICSEMWPHPEILTSQEEAQCLLDVLFR